MSLLLLLSLTALHAAEYRVVRLGDSVESIATELGEPALATDIRSLNQIEVDAQPPIGALLALPIRPGPPLVEQNGAVLHAKGEVSVELPDGEVLAATPGLQLPQGSTVCTAADSYATLRLARSGGSQDHDDVNLLATTCLTLVSAVSRASERASVLRVESGSIAIRSADEIPGTVVVETEAGITTGSGGGFRVTREADATRTEAVEAPVVVMGAGAEVEVGAGQGSRTAVGEAPSAPTDLLLATVAQRPQLDQPLRRPDFGWTAIDGALGYRVEIASSSDFSALVLVDSMPDTTWSPQLLFLPFRVEGLYWRVSAFDRVGFLGLPSETRELVLPAGVGP